MTPWSLSATLHSAGCANVPRHARSRVVALIVEVGALVQPCATTCTYKLHVCPCGTMIETPAAGRMNKRLRPSHDSGEIDATGVEAVLNGIRAAAALRRARVLELRLANVMASAAGPPLVMPVVGAADAVSASLGAAMHARRLRRRINAHSCPTHASSATLPAPSRQSAHTVGTELNSANVAPSHDAKSMIVMNSSYVLLHGLLRQLQQGKAHSSA